VAPKQVALVQDSFAKVALNLEDTSMAGIHSLDRLIGDEYPTFATEADVRAFELAPYADRIAAQSTYDAIKLGAAKNPDAPAIQFLPNADPADTPIVISHRDFVARVTQAANMFHALGANGSDVVSFLLPLLPEAFITLFGAEAACIANPVNPLLEPHPCRPWPGARHGHMEEGGASPQQAEAP
jgi:fatty-acyl-CoA synthase